MKELILTVIIKEAKRKKTKKKKKSLHIRYTGKKKVKQEKVKKK